MKNKDRIRMLLHPEQYTDEQLDQMLNETSIPVPDVQEEWRQFKSQRQHRRRQKTVIRWAAIIVTLAALSGITYAAIQHFWLSGDAKEETQAVSQQKTAVQEVDGQEAGAGVASMVENDTIKHDQQFNNVELQQIMLQLSHDYGVKVVFKSEVSRTLRFYLNWEANDSIEDIIDRINHFEKVHLTLSGETVTIE